MAVTVEQVRSLVTGTLANRVAALRMMLGYPICERDPEQNLFGYLRPGEDGTAVAFTLPITVGFHGWLDWADAVTIAARVTDWGHEVPRHYAAVLEKPVMYLLLPTGEGQGRVALVLPGVDG